MHQSAFNSLLTGPLSSRLAWERSHRCPCVDTDGASDRKCQVCAGRGRYWDEFSDEFRAGLVGLSARAMAAIQQRHGPGLTGDATLSLPGNAPPYAQVGEGDRFLALEALDPLEWTLTPGTRVRLPYGACLIRAKARSSDASSVVAVDPPEPDATGHIQVAVATVISFRAPRRYEVVKDLSQVRAFAPGLPKKLLLKIIDWTVR